MHAGSESPTGTSWKDGGGDNSDELSIRSIKVVNPHSWNVFAKIAKLRLGEREPTHTDAFAERCEPTKA